MKVYGVAPIMTADFNARNWRILAAGIIPERLAGWDRAIE